MFILDEPDLYSRTSACLDWLAGLKNESGAGKQRFHIYWNGVVGRKIALCIKSFLATQDMNRCELHLWLDTRTAWREHLRSPWLKPLLPHIQAHAFDLRRELAATGLGDRRLSAVEEPTQRSNFARLALLWHHGGWYVDADTVFLRDLRPLASEFPNDDLCCRWAMQPFANNAVLRLDAQGDTATRLLENAFDRQSARARDLMRFSESLDVNLLVLPSAVFDPLWLHHDGKDTYKDAPFDKFGDFFAQDDSLTNVDRGEMRQAFFPGAFAYHWHNRWQVPEVSESWFGLLEEIFDEIVSDRYDLRHEPAPVHVKVESWKFDRERFRAEGYLGPVELFSESLCGLIAGHAASDRTPEPADWPKGRAVTDRFFYDIALQPGLLAIVRSILGNDVVLWGASIIRCRRGREHPWHVDIESAGGEGRFLTVWVGLQNTSVDSSLRLISRSHGFGRSLQEVAAEKGVPYGRASDEDVLRWAREHDSGAAIVAPAEVDGDAVFFDGRLWHGSRNPTDHHHRVALLLQYATADAPVRMRARNCFEWPFIYSQRKPPVLLVSGSASGDTNRIVPPPPAGSGHKTIVTRVTPIGLPLPEEPRRGWKPYHFFRGSTPVVDVMGCHASVLSPGHCPHPPHAHLDEELLMVLDGEAEVVIADAPDKPTRIEAVKPGQFMYYPALQHHTIRNCSDRPVTYLMFKWRAAPAQIPGPLGTEITFYRQLPPKAATRPRDTWLLIEGPTAYLGKLHAHFTELQPGAGYAPHRDPYDVAIVLLEGTVTTLGRTLSSGAVVYYSANEPHGMHNPGDDVARYLVFEFHPASPVSA